MDITSLLYSLLSTGTALAASNAATEFGKGLGKQTLDRLTSLLTARGARSVSLIDHVADNPSLEVAIKADLAKPAILADPEILKLAHALEAAIDTLPKTEKAPYAIKIREIHAGRDLLFRNVEGVLADSTRSEGNMIFEGITAPGKR